MKLVYRVKFEITNLDKYELRDFKINLVTSNNVLEFDSESAPRIPQTNEVIKIGGRDFKLEKYYSEFIIENKSTINVFNISIYDVEKKKEEEEKRKNLLNELKHFKQKERSESIYDHYNKYEEVWIGPR